MCSSSVRQKTSLLLLLAANGSLFPLLTFCAPLKSARSSLMDWFTSMIRDPASSCITRDDVTIGEIPAGTPQSNEQRTGDSRTHSENAPKASTPERRERQNDRRMYDVYEAD